MNQQQRQMIAYLREENRVLREQLGGRRLRLTHNQRRRLATKAKGLGRKRLCCENLNMGVKIEDQLSSIDNDKQFLKEPYLSDHIIFDQPPNPSLVNPVHRFDSLQRSPSRPEGTIAQGESSSTFHKAVILLHHSI